MEDTVSTLNSMFEPLSENTNMDFGAMDDLFIGGRWLETTDCSDFFHHSEFASAKLPCVSHFSPTYDTYNISSYPNTPQNFDHDDTEKSSFYDTPSLVETHIDSVSGNHSHYQNITFGAESSWHSNSSPADEEGNLGKSEMTSQSSILSRGWLNEPRGDPDHVLSVKERLVHVLRYVKERAKEGDILLQLWVPVKRGSIHVLTTCGQPFSLNPYCERLVNYRMVSTDYIFSAEENSNLSVGLPGRVFLGKLPEWTPDVQYFSSEEYARVDYAQRYDIRGSLALPIFEQGSQTCLGVVEVVMITQRTNYQPELQEICNALQAVDLRTSGLLSVPHPKVVGSNSYKVVLPEILEVIRAVGETHQLPLAQTWVPCIQQGKKGSRHTDENYPDCVSTVDDACWVSGPLMRGFHNACSEHHLFRGQGVAGKAFTTNQPCFSPDVTSLSKTEYPLSHYARMYGLHAAVAIRLRSVCTGTVDYVLEFFLPVECRDGEEQKLMLNSLSVIIQQFCRSLRVLTNKEVEDENDQSTSKTIPCCGTSVNSVSSVGPNRIPTQEMVVSPSIGTSQGKSSRMHLQRKSEGIATPACAPLGCQKQEPQEFDVGTDWGHLEVDLQSKREFSDIKPHCTQDSAKDNVEDRGSFSRSLYENSGNATERKRAKSEKTISLQVLRQYFAGSLKDAAKSIGGSYDQHKFGSHLSSYL